MSVYNPRQTIIVTSRAKGFDNATTFSWHTPLSVQPYLYAIVARKSRKIYEMIGESRVFCVNFLTPDMENWALFCGTKSGHRIDKFKEGSIPKEKCVKIDSARITGCPAYLECRLIKEVEAGDHLILVGEVVNEVFQAEGKRLFQNNAEGPFTFTTTIE